MDVRSRPTALIAVAAVTFLAGLAAGRTLTSPPGPQPDGAAVSDAQYDASPSHDEAPDAPATGFPHTRDGAVEAATAYGLALDGPLLLDPSGRSALLQDIASDAARAELESTLARGADLIVTNLGLTDDRISEPGFVWRVVPGGWQVRSYDGTRATVAIWATGVVLADGRPLAMPEWRTTEVELVWERDDWRLIAFATTPGPAPSLAGDASTAGIATRINAFIPYGLTVADPSAEATR